MSGFERILARVGGDALRSYCSSAIEDELRNLQTRMRSCLGSVEQALKVQEAVARLDVPLSRENAATCSELKRKFLQFSGDLKQFVDEQRKLQAEAPEPEEAPESESRKGEPKEKATKLLGKIKHRITRKRNDAWIDKSLADVETIAGLMGDETFEGPDKSLRNELVLVLDHLISAVLLSPLTTHVTLAQLDKVLKKLANLHDDIDEYIKSSSALLEKKRASYALKSRAESVNVVDAADEHRVKRQRVEAAAPQDDFLVKVERTAAANAAAEEIAANANSDTTYEVYVSDLPFATTKEADVASYFGIAGAVVSVQMPTMGNGSTVGVAIVRFAGLEGMRLALRMDGYPFNGKNIRVAVHKSR